MHVMESHYTDVNNLDIKVNINNIKIIYESVLWKLLVCSSVSVCSGISMNRCWGSS